MPSKTKPVLPGRFSVSCSTPSSMVPLRAPAPGSTPPWNSPWVHVPDTEAELPNAPVVVLPPTVSVRKWFKSASVLADSEPGAVPPKSESADIGIPKKTGQFVVEGFFLKRLTQDTCQYICKRL